MITTTVIIAAIALQASPDSGRAIDRARSLISDYYSDHRGGGSPNVCEGVRFSECMAGDWDCPKPWCGSEQFLKPRPELALKLDEVAALAGGSAWVFRQRVGLALKMGELIRAREIAQSCYGTEWWCAALRGFAEHHIAAGTGLAQFDTALASAPDSIACTWSALPQSADGLGGTCARETATVARYWFLADPLWSVPGNERKAEHFSRHVAIAIHADIMAVLHGRTIGAVPHYSTLRAARLDHIVADGFPNSWRIPNLPKGQDVHPRGTHFNPELYVFGGYSFAPDAAALRDPIRTTSESWEVEWNKGAERMIPAQTWYNLEHQTVVLRRGAQLRLTAAAVLPPDLTKTARLNAALALGRITDLQVTSSPARIQANVFRAEATADSADYLVSIEVVGSQVIGRARHGAIPPPLVSDFGVSDIALVDTQFESDSLSLSAALLPSTKLPKGSITGVYFELYGVSPGEAMDLDLSAHAGGLSFTRRVFSWMGLASQRSPVRITWKDEPERIGESVRQRFLTLDLRALPVGEHTLTLSARRSDGSRVSVSRGIRIVE